MIKIIDNDFLCLNQFKEFCKSSSFGTRIYSHYLCYGHNLSFADFWVQVIDDDIACAFCRLDGDFVVCLSDSADFAEVAAFLKFQDKLSITFDEKYSKYLDIDYDNCTYGDVLVYVGSDKPIPDFTTLTPQLRQYHDLLMTCESDDFFVPQYHNFLSDVSRRQQRDMCEICGIETQGLLVSCAMTVSQTDFSVILGAVATHPQHRKHGYAGCVVRTLAQHFAQLDSVFIYTTIERNSRYYEGQGFKLCGKWIKYIYGG